MPHSRRSYLCLRCPSWRQRIQIGGRRTRSRIACLSLRTATRFPRHRPYYVRGAGQKEIPPASSAVQLKCPVTLPNGRLLSRREATAERDRFEILQTDDCIVANRWRQVIDRIESVLMMIRGELAHLSIKTGWLHGRLAYMATWQTGPHGYMAVWPTWLHGRLAYMATWPTGPLGYMADWPT